MESIQSKLSVSAMTAYFGIFKEPRGFIRLLQFIFAIFAFATACSGSSAVEVATKLPSIAITASWSYPYNLKNTPIQIAPNNATNTLSDANDVKPAAEFFVFTGVTSMLLALALIVVYIFLDRQYRNDERIPIADFVVTIVWAIFWLAGSSAWAQGVNNIRAQTKWLTVAQRSNICTNAAECSESYSGTYANVIVSVIFGYLNFILWVGAAWFIYKETKFFKSRTAQQQQTEVPASNFSNMSSPPMQQPPSFRSPSAMS